MNLSSSYIDHDCVVKFIQLNSKASYSHVEQKFNKYEYNNTLYSVKNITRKLNQIEIRYKLLKYFDYKQKKLKMNTNILHSACIVETKDNFFVFGVKNDRIKLIGGMYEQEIDKLANLNDLVVGAKREVEEELQFSNQISKIIPLSLMQNPRKNMAFVCHASFDNTKKQIQSQWRSNRELDKLVFTRNLKKFLDTNFRDQDFGIIKKLF